MIEKILNALEEQQIGEYLLLEVQKEITELFFIKKNLDMRRAENVRTCQVTVYRDFEKDGQPCKGESAFVVEPSATKEEISEKCRRAYLAAGFVANPHYELFAGTHEETVTVESSLVQMSAEEAAGAMTKALFAADDREKSFLNSAELFIEKKNVHIRNSKGVDVSYVKYHASGEIVAQCKEPQDVETFKNFSYDELNTDALTDLVRQTLKMTEDRAMAQAAPVTGTYDVVLSDEYAATIFDFYRARGGGDSIYQHYSDYKVGDFVQGKPEEVTGELLFLDYVPTVPFSDDGVPMKKLPCISKGVFQNIQANVRYAHYLNVPATGWYRKLSCAPGGTDFEKMKKQPGLYVVNFSDFQMDEWSGHFGGEIRLAYLNDGETITPVTGGSINGSIFEAQKSFVFSKETQDISKFCGPKAVLLKNVSVAGRTAE
ncbi:MAG: metallopeptidase TldD-related protein [Lachnospiraceae bacterium]|nr:metallopeptidase TldD-related protein [Lachnospiraceae bacterium]